MCLKSSVLLIVDIYVVKYMWQTLLPKKSKPEFSHSFHLLHCSAVSTSAAAAQLIFTCPLCPLCRTCNICRLLVPTKCPFAWGGARFVETLFGRIQFEHPLCFAGASLIVTWQLKLTLDSIRNSHYVCDKVYILNSDDIPGVWNLVDNICRLCENASFKQKMNNVHDHNYDQNHTSILSLLKTHSGKHFNQYATSVISDRQY